MIDPNNYGYPVVLKTTGMLNNGITRWEKINKNTPGPKFIVSKVVCWMSENRTNSPYLIDESILTRGNVEHEKEMLQWAQKEGLGPILYASETNDKCSIFAIQYFDSVLLNLNKEIQKRKMWFPEIVKLYTNLLADADYVSTRIDNKIANGTIIMDIKPDNIAIDLENQKVRILDWGAARAPNKDCWGGLIYQHVADEFFAYVRTFPVDRIPPQIQDLAIKVNNRLNELEQDKAKKSVRIDQCSKNLSL